MKYEVLHGQIMECSLLLRNEGGAAAQSVYIKTSHPGFVFASPDYRDDVISSSSSPSPTLLKHLGHSATVTQLVLTEPLLPGQELRFPTWIRLDEVGLQHVSLLACYHSGSNVNVSVTEGSGAGSGTRSPLPPSSVIERFSVFSFQVSYSYK